eukprot:scaffold29528_cov77-Isochrysis_galbana.AAC.3
MHESISIPPPPSPASARGRGETAPPRSRRATRRRRPPRPPPPSPPPVLIWAAGRPAEAGRTAVKTQRPGGTESRCRRPACRGRRWTGPAAGPRTRSPRPETTPPPRRLAR